MAWRTRGSAVSVAASLDRWASICVRSSGAMARASRRWLRTTMENPGQQSSESCHCEQTGDTREIALLIPEAVPA